MIEYIDAYDERSALLVEESLLPEDTFRVSIETEYDTVTMYLSREDLLDFADEIIEELA